MERAGRALGEWLGTQFEWSKDDREIASFSLTLIMSTLFFIGALLLLASLAGVLKEAIIMACASGILKAFAGGAHFSTGWRCGIISASAATSAAWIAHTFGAELGARLGVGVAAVTLVSAVGVAAVMHRRAPVDVPEKPITSQVQRARLRKVATAIPLVWGALIALVWVTSQSGWSLVDADTLFAFWMASTIGLFWETFSVIPSGTRFVHWLDNQIEQLVRGT